MSDFAPQTAAGKVLWHFTMSLDGFVAGPDHDMSWMATGISMQPGLLEPYIETTGAVLAGRRGWDAFPSAEFIYGGAFTGPVFVMTHHPEDAEPADRVTFLNCDLAEAVQIALTAADGKNVECSRRTSAANSSSGGCSTRSTCTSRRCCWGRASACTSGFA